MNELKIRILGTESLGVRGLCCVAEAGDRKIVIDPGIALGYRRNGLLPHPVQVGVGEIIRQRIIAELADATDVVFSHFHGDHIPLADANPFQLSIAQVRDVLSSVKLWAKGSQGSSFEMRKRAANLVFGLNRSISDAEGQGDDIIQFSHAVPHGEEGSTAGEVMLTRITDGKNVFVHASDIQFLSERAIAAIMEFKPHIVLASGPPVYLSSLTAAKRDLALMNIVKLSEQVDCLIVDHHLLRSWEGMECLRQLDMQSRNKIMCAADYMQREPQLLEASRVQMYKDIPVPEGWHDDYARGNVNTEEYLKQARVLYQSFAY